MRALLSSVARQWFPSKAAGDRVIPWLQLTGVVIGGIFALHQLDTGISDKRANDTVKLLDQYFERKEKEPSLKDDFEELRTDAAAYAFQGIERLRDGASEDEKRDRRLLLLKREREFLSTPANERRYRRVLTYFDLVTSCSAQGRCDTKIVNGTIGGDIYGFLNNSCGYFDQQNARWGGEGSGLNLFRYVTEQRLYRIKAGTNPFRCEPFRALYDACPRLTVRGKDLVLLCP